MIEAAIAIAICLFICTFTIMGLFVGTPGRASWKIATSFAISAVILVIAIIIHGPVPEDHVAAERQSVTESDN